MKTRNYNYDILRIFACMLIICMHAPIASPNANGMFLSAVSYFTAPGLCLFFVISGALLLPVKMDTFSFLKKRLGKVIAPTVFFSIIYLVISINESKDIDYIKSICSIPLSPQGNGVLWFMYTLIGLYLLSPIISKWLVCTNKLEFEFYLLLWLIAQCYPIIGLICKVQTNETGILYYFSGYIGYFLLGYYLKTYPEVMTIKRLLFPTVIAVVAPVVCKLAHLEVDFYSMFWYLSIFVTILTIALFKIFTIKKIELSKGGKTERLIETTSSMTFGIYLIHIAIMRGWLWKQEFITNISIYYFQWLLISCLTFILSWAVCYIISFLPFANYIIGYKQNRK